MKTEEAKPAMLTLVGRGVSPGLAAGTAYVYIDVLQRECEGCDISAAQIGDEQDKICRAVEDVRSRLRIDAKQMESKLTRESVEIFHAHEAMLMDSSVIDKLQRTVERQHVNAEQAVRNVFRGLAARFRKMTDEVLRERADDVEDLLRRLLLSLGGIHAHSLENLSANSVLVASRLLPSDTVFLSRWSTVAVLAEFAGPAAHAALLARELGIPCVGGIPGLLDAVQTGDIVLVDGTRGTAMVHPDAETHRHFAATLECVRQHKQAVVTDSRQRQTVTRAGAAVSVLANVRSREDVELAMDVGADGIGLFRSEPFFMAAAHFPTSRELATFLLDSLRRARGMRVDVRLLDIGADKIPHYLQLPREPDPFLGRRGVRILLESPDLLDAQLIAMLEVSRHIPIGVLIPMVSTEDDVARVAARLHELAGKSAARDLPRLGAMIETPAAALAIPALRQHVDFFSIGTNDLTQYTMAAGRENPLVSQYFIDDHPAVLRLIELVVSEAGDTPVSLCGELAGRIEVMPRLLATGIRSLSVAAALVPEVKNAVRNA